jgi:hypothetical protein
LDISVPSQLRYTGENEKTDQRRARIKAYVEVNEGVGERAHVGDIIVAALTPQQNGRAESLAESPPQAKGLPHISPREVVSSFQRTTA